MTNLFYKQRLCAVTFYFLFSNIIFAQDNPDTAIDEIVVTGKKHVLNLSEQTNIAPDSATLLQRAPGTTVNRNGALSGIIQYRGLTGYRINTRIDGSVISAGGPNWMDTPLSYAPAAQLESLEIYRGIAPVRAGNETLGGAVNAITKAGDFSTSGITTSGQLLVGGQSVNSSSSLNGSFAIADEHRILMLMGMSESADDADFARGKILASEYERQRYDIQYRQRNNQHEFKIKLARNETGDSGTPALPMDIGAIDTDIADIAYRYDADTYTLNGQLYNSQIYHSMTNYHLRPAPTSGGLWRKNIAEGDNAGFSLALNTANWLIGVDGHVEKHERAFKILCHG